MSVVAPVPALTERAARERCAAVRGVRAGQKMLSSACAQVG